MTLDEVPHWTVRPATGEEVERLQTIEVDAGERFRSIGLGVIADDDPPATDVLRAHIDGGTCWVAVSGDQVLGYATGSVVDGEGHLDQVSLIGAAAGHGIGRALIETVIRWAEEAGLATITLTTFRDVAWNGPYYRRLGFVDLTEDELGPELRSIRAEERAAGIDLAPRVAMRRAVAIAGGGPL